MFIRQVLRAAFGWSLLLALPLLAAPASADSVLYVTSSDGSVKRYDGSTGAFIDTFLPAGSGNADGLAVGPNGNLYLPAGGAELRGFDGVTGASLGAPATWTERVPRDTEIGSDGNVYVISGVLRTIRKHDAATGTFLMNAASGLSSAFYFSFGPDGLLYVSENGVFNRINRYDPTTGAFVDVFVPLGSGGTVAADFKAGIRFGPDGNLYWAIGGNPLASSGTDAVLRFNGTTGAFIDIFVPDGSGGLHGSTDLQWGPDGNLYVGSYATSSILRYNGTTGAFMGAFVTSGSGGLSNPRHFDFYTTTAVAEPTTLLCAGTAVAMLLRRRRRGRA